MNEQIVSLTEEAKELYPQFANREDYNQSQVMFTMESGDVMLYQPLHNRKIWNPKYLVVIKEWYQE